MPVGTRANPQPDKPPLQQTFVTNNMATQKAHNRKIDAPTAVVPSSLPPRSPPLTLIIPFGGPVTSPAEIPAPSMACSTHINHKHLGSRLLHSRAGLYTKFFEAKSKWTTQGGIRDNRAKS
eukprot:1192040-Prorocentrum_minimum.AAC.1